MYAKKKNKESLLLTDYQTRIKELALLQKGWNLTVLDTLCKDHSEVQVPIITLESDEFEIYIWLS